ncbi:branched-chain amino acid transport system II carrier protein [Cytobacillus praedii]|uniref:Branched-chain amino acid transport system carrier protein n=1 Tax=Cytobacillus praedii TaxID=1742358 RepID=A0A4R1B3R0_9BACI|nr:branched-chain amino acid transport system II carrier protein [Cytobacillus praedii]MED3570791.1 branched-chain amino acid transport system II carrier protein [Cytobacillus praedii]TCJ04637.1 branched-chain amino acid transport system II carrier protein [Cytobacillus praedii]
MNSNLSTKQIMAVGLMLFALFFGAGNMIFPPFLGQDAGTHVWTAIIGFLITGVGLPLLAIIAIARVGDVQTMASRVHPVYGVIFTVIMYLVIGPLFAIPRTGTVSYEIGVIPFLSENAVNSPWPLIIFSIVFFAITAWLAMNPTKLVDTIGKILTPALLIILALIVIKALITPLGEPQAPVGPYADGAFFKGFIEGYSTMDTIAALVFGIIVITSIQGLGVSNKKSITKICVQAGLIAAAGLALVYLSLAYIGSTAPDAIGIQENGGALLSKAADHLFGSFGSIILALAIVFACLTTSIGLVSACATYFNKLMPRFSYKTIVLIFSIFSMIIANIGLTQLIAFSVPVLVIIYPLAIVLIVLSFFHNFFKGYSLVYIVALIPTGIISIIDGLKAAGLNISALTDALGFLPLFNQGIGWVVPAIIGALIGYFIALATGKSAKTIPTN